MKELGYPDDSLLMVLESVYRRTVFLCTRYSRSPTLLVTGDPALLAPAITPPGAPEHDLPPAVCGPNGPRWSLNSVPVDAALYWSRQLARVPTLRLAL